MADVDLIARSIALRQRSEHLRRWGTALLDDARAVRANAAILRARSLMLRDESASRLEQARKILEPPRDPA